MDGVGSRFGRSSSRYGSAPPSAAFGGPVRKWKKQWVSTQPATHRNGCNKAGAVIFLCRWIPLPSASPSESTLPQMSSKRKFRYAPIVDMEEKKREIDKKVENEEANTRSIDKSNSAATLGSGPILNKQNINDILNADFQEASISKLHPNKKTSWSSPHLKEAVDVESTRSLV